MPTIEYSGLKINLDDEGHLVNGDDWNEKVACALAEREGIEELTKERMEILSFLRDYYRRFNYFLSWMQCVLTSTTQPVRQGKIHASAKGLEDSRSRTMWSLLT